MINVYNYAYVHLWYICCVDFMYYTSLLLSVSPNIAEGGVNGSNTSQMQAAFYSTGQQAQKLFGFMKDGAGKLFKNIKDSSSTVIQQVTKSVSYNIYMCIVCNECVPLLDTS